MSRIDGLTPSLIEVFEARIPPGEEVLEVVKGKGGDSGLVVTDVHVYLRHRRGFRQTLDLSVWPREAVVATNLTLGTLTLQARESDGRVAVCVLTPATGDDVRVAVDRACRILAGNSADPEMASVPLPIGFAPAMPPGEEVTAFVAGRNGTGLAFTLEAIYGRVQTGLLGPIVDHRWPVWAVAEVRGSPAIDIVVRDVDVFGRPPKRFVVHAQDAMLAKETVRLAWERVLAVLGQPGADRTVEAELTDVSEGWSVPTLVRRYVDTTAGHERLHKETVVFGRHGYQLVVQSAEKGKLKTGQLIATGGIGAGIAYARGKGGIHEVGVINATFMRGTPDTSPWRLG